MTKMVEVTQEDANNYCRVLTALGMEEEGDPADEIERLQSEVYRLRAAIRVRGPGVQRHGVPRTKRTAPLREGGE